MAIEFSVPDIDQAMVELIKKIPPGRVTTYRAVAEALGDPSVVRFVAQWLSSPKAEGLPVHRVVHATGALGRLPFATVEEAAEKLRAEGVRVVGDRVEPLSRFFFWDFPTDRPLAQLQAEQDEIAHQVRLEPLPKVETVAGLDIAYRGDEAVAVYVLCWVDGEVVDYVWAKSKTRFPYIPTYLSWREIPSYLAVIEAAQDLSADVILVDGNGILHPRRAGIAAHLGVLLDRPTVGVAKNRLCGEVNTEGMMVGEWRPVIWQEEMVGAALRTGRNRTLFVSPGHRADLGSAVELVFTTVREYPYPEPLRWAHALANEASRSEEPRPKL